MEPQPTVRWWKRLLLGFAATIIVWLSTAIVLTCFWLWRTPQDRHWFTNPSGGGILEDLRITLITGGFVALDLYVLLAAPLVLVWPVKSQLKHWYAFLCTAALLPVAYAAIPFLRHPLLIYREGHISQLFFFAWPAIPFLCGMVCYLLLLRRQRTRLIRN